MSTRNGEFENDDKAADRFAEDLEVLRQRAVANGYVRESPYLPIPPSPVYDSFVREMGYER